MVESIVYWIHLPEHTDILSEGYIGVTNNLKRRISEHRSNTNEHLNNAFKKYTNIVCDIVVKSDDYYCLYVEEKLRPIDKIGWNVIKGGGKPPSAKGRSRPDLILANQKRDRNGTNNSMYGKTHSTDTRKTISEKIKGKYIGENNPMYGKKRTELSERNKLNKGKSWYNNGIKSKQLFENEIPTGWVKGRII